MTAPSWICSASASCIGWLHLRHMPGTGFRLSSRSHVLQHAASRHWRLLISTYALTVHPSSKRRDSHLFMITNTVDLLGHTRLDDPRQVCVGTGFDAQHFQSDG